MAVSGCLGLSAVGGVLEVAGLGTVAWEVSRVQREEFGLPRTWVRVSGALRGAANSIRARLNPSRGKSHTAYVDAATGTASASGSLVLTTGRGPAVLLEDKVRRLELVVEDLRDQIEQNLEVAETRASALQDRIARVDGRVATTEAERERRRKATLRRQITVQAVGTALFFAGALFSFLGNAVSC